MEWTAVPAAVQLILTITAVTGCLAFIIYMMGRLNGWTKISLKLFGQGFTIERDSNGSPTPPKELLPTEPDTPKKKQAKTEKRGRKSPS